MWAMWGPRIRSLAVVMHCGSMISDKDDVLVHDNLFRPQGEMCVTIVFCILRIAWILYLLRDHNIEW